MSAWFWSGKPFGLLFLLLFLLSAVGERWGIKITLTGTNIGLSLLGLMLLFQDRLGPFLKRIIRFKWGDTEVEFEKKVEQLVVQAAETEVEKTAALPVEPPPPDATSAALPQMPTSLAMPLHQIFAVAPRLGVMEVARQLEVNLRLILLGAGWTTTEPQPFRKLVETASQKQVIPSETAKSLTTFWQLRNYVTHSHLEPLSNELLTTAFEAGVQMLDLLDRLRSKFEQHKVAAVNVEVFHDPVCNQKIASEKAVILESQREGQTMRRIFPTRRDYQVGQMVSWHWDMKPPHVGPAWFRDPLNNGKITQAWSSAGHFAGEPLAPS